MMDFATAMLRVLVDTLWHLIVLKAQEIGCPDDLHKETEVHTDRTIVYIF